MSSPVEKAQEILDKINDLKLSVDERLSFFTTLSLNLLNAKTKALSNLQHAKEHERRMEDHEGLVADYNQYLLTFASNQTSPQRSE